MTPRERNIKERDIKVKDDDFEDVEEIEDIDIDDEIDDDEIESTTFDELDSLEDEVFDDEEDDNAIVSELDELTHTIDIDGEKVPSYCFVHDITNTFSLSDDEAIKLAKDNGYVVYKVTPNDADVESGLVIADKECSKDLIVNDYKKFFGVEIDIEDIVNDDEEVEEEPIEDEVDIEEPVEDEVEIKDEVVEESVENCKVLNEEPDMFGIETDAEIDAEADERKKVAWNKRREIIDGDLLTQLHNYSMLDQMGRYDTIEKRKEFLINYLTNRLQNIRKGPDYRGKVDFAYDDEYKDKPIDKDMVEKMADYIIDYYKDTDDFKRGLKFDPVLVKKIDTPYGTFELIQSDLVTHIAKHDGKEFWGFTSGGNNKWAIRLFDEKVKNFIEWKDREKNKTNESVIVKYKKHIKESTNNNIEVCGYYGDDYTGLADSDEFDNEDSALDYVWELLSKGELVEVHGGSISGRYNPDKIDFETFEPDYDSIESLKESSSLYIGVPTTRATTKVRKFNTEKGMNKDKNKQGYNYSYFRVDKDDFKGAKKTTKDDTKALKSLQALGKVVTEKKDKKRSK